MSKEVTIVSGGIDSVTLAVYVSRIGRDQEVISFEYGQMHSKEIIYAQEISEEVGAKHHIVIMEWLKNFVLEDPSGEVKPEKYGIDSIFLSIAYALALSIEASQVNYASYNCKPEFITAMSHSLQMGSNSQINIAGPFCHLRKSDIVKIGSELGVDYRKTWSCSKGEKYHCGKCINCMERIEAFKNCGIEDPTIYELSK